jgi:hypothetical protein
MESKQTTIPENLNVFYIVSATIPNKVYKVYEDKKKWYCSGEDGNPAGACDHFKYHKETPCRHILQAQLRSLYMSFKTGQELFEALCLETIRKRDIRDVNCDDFESVIERLWTFKGGKMALLSGLMLRIAVIRGKVTTDDVHDATGERFYGDRTIGSASGSLLRSGLLKVIGRQPTKRPCAHGRGLYIFAITDAGLDVLNAQRPEKRMEDFEKNGR